MYHGVLSMCVFCVSQGCKTHITLRTTEIKLKVTDCYFGLAASIAFPFKFSKDGLQECILYIIYRIPNS